MMNYLNVTSPDLTCQLVTSQGCTNTTAGLNCTTSGTTVDYSCDLTGQNDTYTCARCNSSVCEIELKIMSALDEASKYLWLRIPDVNCSWNVLQCLPNRTFYIDAFDGDPNRTAPETFQCSFSFANETDTVSAGYEWSFLFVILFIVAGGVGNILVCLAVCLDKRLQNVTNYFLLSLAIADLLVSLFVMPMGAIPGFLGYWPLGVVWCNVYVTCDVLACSASIMHMCFISIGRYLGIRNPLKSRHHSTKRVVFIKIALVWLLSMFVSSSITVLGLINRTNIMPTPSLCVINNRLFWVLGSLVAFYIPMLTMVVSFALTVQLLKRQARLAATPVPGGTQRRQCGGLESGSVRCVRRLAVRSSPDLSPAAPRHLTWRVTATRSARKIGMSVSHPQLYANGCGRQRDAATQTPRSIVAETRRIPLLKAAPNALSLRSARKIGMSVSHPQLYANGCGRQRDAATQTPRSIVAETRRIPLLKAAPNALSLRFLANRKKDRPLSANAVANEQKATKVLGLVFFTFVLCWAPFFLLNILFASCPACIVPEHVVDICLWLGYVSSTINPIIYTVFNRTFRAAFLRLLKCHCTRRGRCTRYKSTDSNRGASQLCARSALPLAISLRPLGLTASNQIPQTTETVLDPPINEYNMRY